MYDTMLCYAPLLQLHAAPEEEQRVGDNSPAGGGVPAPGAPAPHGGRGPPGAAVLRAGHSQERTARRPTSSLPRVFTQALMRYLFLIVTTHISGFSCSVRQNFVRNSKHMFVATSYRIFCFSSRPGSTRR